MPEKLLPPERNRQANSTHRLSRLDVQRASTDIKRFVEARLETDFNLVKASRHVSDVYHAFHAGPYVQQRRILHALMLYWHTCNMHVTDLLTPNPVIHHPRSVL